MVELILVGPEDSKGSPMRSRDPYQTLGIRPGSSPEQVQAAYRRLARQWHPDHNPGNPRAGEMFHQLTEAYRHLQEAERRQVHEARKTQQEAGHPDLEAPVTLTSQQADVGSILRFSVPRAEVCGGCGGIGRWDGSAAGSCRVCHGSGYQDPIHSWGTWLRPLCNVCGGSGRVVKESRREGPCPTCRGLGMTLKEVTIEVRVPPGTREGTRLRVRGQGRPLLRGGRGDLYLVIHISS
jgi:molecular chaperone DnaJ